MSTLFITNDKGEKTAAIIPIAEYEDLLHEHHLHLELTDEYKKMMDNMLDEEAAGNTESISLDTIKNIFSVK